MSDDFIIDPNPTRPAGGRTILRLSALISLCSYLIAAAAGFWRS